MKEYEICKVASNEYDAFLLCLTFESILGYLEHIESEPLITKSKCGTLLIDQLLTTGNGRNRYICCKFCDGRIDISSVTNVSPNEYYREISLNLLRDNIELLHNSILTDIQRVNIIRGIIF